MKFTPFSADRKSSHQFTNLSVRITQEDDGFTVQVRLYSQVSPENTAWGEEPAELLGSRFNDGGSSCRRVFDFGGADQD